MSRRQDDAANGPMPIGLKVTGFAPGEVPGMHVFYATEADREEALLRAIEGGQRVKRGDDCSVVWL